MTCRRAFDVDLAAYLVDPRAAEWTEFRDHWPACPDCAAEVAAWTALQARLGPWHPDAGVLLRWADGDGTLPAAERLAIARHVEGCAACTDELRALARFEIAPQATPNASRLRRIVWNPAVAYALLLLALIPTITRQHDALEPRPDPVTVSAPAGGTATAPQQRAAEAPAEKEARGAGAGAPAPPPPPPAAPAPEAEVADGAPLGRARSAAPADDAEPPATFIAVALPEAARAAGVAEIRVRDASGDRDLRERIAVRPDLATYALALPPTWRDHTTYEIEVRVPGTGVVERQRVTVP